MQLISLSTIILYLLVFGLTKSYPNLEWLLTIPGLLLLYYLPGRNLNELILPSSKTRNGFGFLTRISLDVAVSIATITILYLIIRSWALFDFNKTVVAVLALNVLLLFANALRTKFKLLLTVERFDVSKLQTISDRKYLIVLAIPLILFIVRLLFNPYIYELDSSQYFHIFNDIIDRGFDTSWLTGQRIGFSQLMMYSHFVADISFIGFIKFFTPVLFYLTVFPLLEVSSSKWPHLTKISFLSYLMVLASPFLIISNEGVRPETFLLILTIPVLYLLYQGLKTGNFLFIIIAGVLSYVSFRFHELGLFLLIASLIAVLIEFKKLLKSSKDSMTRQPALFSLFVLASSILLFQNAEHFLGLFKSGIFQQLTPTLIKLSQNLEWRWWFLSGYTSVDGGTIFWNGIEALYYYLYNGVIIMPVLIIAYYALIKTRGKKKMTALISKSWIPAVVLLAIYFTIAEVFPRLGVFLLPNRAWPHLFLAAVFLVALINGQLSSKIHAKSRIIKVYETIVILAVSAGIIGTMYGSTYMGGQVLPAEKLIIKELRLLPTESVIVSTQVNQNIIEIYGDRYYAPIGTSKIEDIQGLINLSKQELESLKAKKIAETLDSINITGRSSIVAKINGSQKIFVQSNINVSNPEERLEALKTIDFAEYSYVSNKIDAYNKLSSRPIYYLYSFARLEGVLATREWWYRDNDPDNYDFFKKYTGTDVVYKDASSILIKLFN